METIDYILIGATAFLFLYGYLRGFIRTIFGLGGFIVAIIASYFLSTPLAKIVFKMGFVEDIRISLNNNYSEIAAIDLNSLMGGGNTLDTIGSLANLSPDTLNYLSENPIISKLLGTNSIDTVTELVGSSVTMIDTVLFSVITAICGFIIFIVVKLMLGFFKRSMHRAVSSVKMLNWANRLSGGLLGLTTSYGLIYVFANYLLPVVVWISPSNDFINDVNNSFILGYFM